MPKLFINILLIVYRAKLKKDMQVKIEELSLFVKIVGVHRHSEKSIILFFTGIVRGLKT